MQAATRKFKLAWLLPGGLVFAILIGFPVFLRVISPGTIEPFTDPAGKPVPGSIAEKAFVSIGGVPQGMIIRGRNKDNPVLLFVHGGPGFPEYFLVEKYPSGLEDHFTVCYWEQRGSGLSYSPEVSVESMTLKQLASDALEVTDYLRSRFGKEKIYLMAHSGGSSFAIQAAARAPQKYLAYIGMAQVTRQAESEKLAYRYIRDQYSRSGNDNRLKELRAFSLLEDDSLVLPFFKAPIRDEAMHELGIGTMRSMKSVVQGVFFPVWMCKAYTITEKVNFWSSKFIFLNQTSLAREVIQADITQSVPKLEIPVYFFSGRYDWTVNYTLSKEYLGKLDAPIKGFYTFEQSAHSPIYEETEKLKTIMIQDVLQGRTEMADR